MWPQPTAGTTFYFVHFELTKHCRVFICLGLFCKPTFPSAEPVVLLGDPSGGARLRVPFQLHSVGVALAHSAAQWAGSWSCALLHPVSSALVGLRVTRSVRKPKPGSAQNASLQCTSSSPEKRGSHQSLGGACLKGWAPSSCLQAAALIQVGQQPPLDEGLALLGT